MHRSLAAAFVMFWAWNAPARAGQIGDFGVGHAEFHHFYQHGENGGPIMRPHQPLTRCCDGDCRPTVARKNAKGEWEVLIDGAFERVPPSRIKSGIKNPITRPHVCAPAREKGVVSEIFCFIEGEVEG